MKESLQRVRDVIRGRVPDRPPLFDLLRNDAVISHFAGKELTVENAAEVVPRAFEPAIDATRPAVRLPAHETETTLPDGRQQKIFRWTAWTDRRQYASSEAYAEEKRRALAAFDPAWTEQHGESMRRSLAGFAELRAKLGEVFLVPGIPGPRLMGLFGEVGLEAFSYYLADCPGVIVELLEMNAVSAVSWAENLPDQHGIEVGFLGDDIAFNSGPLLSPVWMREHYFPRLRRIIAAFHARGIKILFHSDGNLNPILGDLVEAGIDGLNPIEVLAGMNVGEIHRRHPHLFMAGGVDVSQLLPFGSPAEVRDAVKEAIDGAGGRIMIGSSTELNNDVPLANYLALRDAVLDS